MRKFGIEALGMGFNNSDYPGAFTEPVKQVIKSVIYGRVLHLYSGSSFIGDVRVDKDHKNATDHIDVGDFVRTDNREWDWVILDPPYNINHADRKLKKYGDTGCVYSNVPLRRRLKNYLSSHTTNILWLDYCAPMIKGFRREKLWLFLPGGFHNVRVLSWLKREMRPLL